MGESMLLDKHGLKLSLYKTINFGGKLSFILSFLSPERLQCLLLHI